MGFKPFTRYEGIVAPMMRNDLEVEFIASPLNSAMSVHSIPDGEIHSHRHGVTRGSPSLGKAGRHAFAAERYLPDGAENPEFMLNQPPYRDASILLMGKNFGVGSMQLMASIQLLQCGVRAVIAASFGPTFYEDSVAVGLLPVTLDTEALFRLQRAAELRPGSMVSIDLERMHVYHRDTEAMTIELSEKVRSRFLFGSTDMDLLNEYQDQTEKVVAERNKQRPWLQ